MSLMNTLMLIDLSSQWFGRLMKLHHDRMGRNTRTLHLIQPNYKFIHPCGLGLKSAKQPVVTVTIVSKEGVL